ncbi:MAG: hypothetical protein IIB38_10140 [Candidatus Hydrogenedentes bacterium]|nr:hypothetical protein [Candidatus Hydrogenedentota bacterium]
MNRRDFLKAGSLTAGMFFSSGLIGCNTLPGGGSRGESVIVVGRHYYLRFNVLKMEANRLNALGCGRRQICLSLLHVWSPHAIYHILLCPYPLVNKELMFLGRAT